MSLHEQQSARERAAADWDVRLRSHACTERDRVEFGEWCRADARHLETFERLQGALGALRQVADHPQVRALRERAEVVIRRTESRRSLLRMSLAACFIVLAIGGSMSRLLDGTGEPKVEGARPSYETTNSGTFVTGNRERRTVLLPDGSSATLDTGTRLDVAWLPNERQIHLVTGQALFHVAKDPSRPFVVTVGSRTVTALGTTFDVRLDPHRLQVTLVEGRIKVAGVGQAARQPPLVLEPDQQLVALDNQLPTVRTVNVALSTGWADGQLFFTDTSLPQAVAEMNRYSDRTIVIGDDALAQYRVNGMFRAGNQEGFVAAITAYYPVDARVDSRGHTVLLPRGTNQTH